MRELRDKYKNLRSIIAQRKLFESQAENQKPPYNNHLTDDNFCDINGYCSLHYGSLLGDVDGVTELINTGAEIEQKPLYLLNGVTSFQMALQVGHLEVAKILFEKGASCQDIATAKVHPICRKWFQEKIIESLQISFPGFLQGDFRKLKASRFYNTLSDSPFQRLAELGYLELLQLARKNYLLMTHMLNFLFVVAAGNGQEKLVTYFTEEGFLANFHEDELKENPLHAAAESHHYAIVTYLLANHAHIDSQNKVKKTPLMLAVENNDDKMVQLLLENGANVLIQDTFGKTVLHHAVEINNLEIFKLLLENSQAEKLLACKNIYGLTAVDCAIDAGNDQQLALIYKNEELEEIRQHPCYAQKNPRIDHRHILPKIYYFLRLLYRDTDFLHLTGHCVGFGELRNIIMSTQKRNYFPDTLRLMSRWDGELETLENPFSNHLPQAKYYDNLLSLYDNWSQNIIWFQGLATTNIMPIAQHETRKKFQIVCPSSEQENSVITVFKDLYGKLLVKEQLIEYLRLIARMPNGTQYNISGGGHLVSGNVIKGGCLAIDYYDSNFEFEIDPQDNIETLADLIINVKYLAINKLSDNMMDVEMHIYYFKSRSINMDSFILFHDDELPQSKSAAIDYQTRSACKFTPLHAAVFTGSILTFEKLLADNYCDTNAKNIFKKTIMDMILESRNLDLLKLLMRYAAAKCNIGKALTASYDLQDKLEKDIFNTLLQYAQASDLISFCIHKIDMGHIEYVENFIDTHHDLINHYSNDGKILLLEAIRLHSISLVKYLLRNGASILKLAKTLTPFMEDPVSITALSYVIRCQKKEFLADILGDSAAKLLPLLTAHCDDNKQEMLNLLSVINFDLTDETERCILLTLLHRAIDTKDSNLIISIIEHCDNKILDILLNDKPLLVHALVQKNIKILEALLGKGAFVDNKTCPGRNTALHVALILKLDEPFIQILLDHSSDTTLKNKENKDAIELAKDCSITIQDLIECSRPRSTIHM